MRNPLFILVLVLLCACNQHGNQNISNSIFLQENTRRRLVLDFDIIGTNSCQHIKTIYYSATAKDPFRNIIHVNDSVKVFTAIDFHEYQPFSIEIRQ